MRRNVAFIDDGIDPAFVPADIPCEHYAALDGMICADEPMNGATHGTVCYTVFRDHVTVPYALVSVKVLDGETRTGNKDNLLAALRFCGEHGIDLIHMSIGTHQFTDRAALYEITERLSADGIVIVAACNNRNTLTYPACFPSVIGVRHVPMDLNNGVFVWVDQPYDNIEVMLRVEDGLLPDGNNSVCSFAASNSLAAPRVTARVCGYLAEGCADVNAVKRRLRAEARVDNVFVDYTFYRQLLHEWKTIDIPLVAIPGKGAHDAAARIIYPLIEYFNHDEYDAVGLSTTIPASIGNRMFRLGNHWPGGSVSLYDEIKLYYNFIRPDIILLHTDMDNIIRIDRETPFDALIADPPLMEWMCDTAQDRITLDIHRNITDIYRTLVNKLTA